MGTLRTTLDRLLPAFLMAVGAMLVLTGLLSLDVVPVAGDGPGGSPAPIAVASEEPGSPLDTPGGAATPGASGEPPIVATLPPTPSPVPTPTRSGGPSAPPSTGRSPAPSARPTLPSGEVVVASRVRVPSLGVDLPVVSGDVDVPGNADRYPLCDVAQFLTSEGFVQPYEPGTTYVYAHARAGMFLPMLAASQERDGASMLGSLVQVYTSDGRVWLYEIFQVKRHATDFSLAFDVPEGERRVILQTSEGPTGHIPKLQVAGRLIGEQRVSAPVANPVPVPRVCT